MVCRVKLVQRTSWNGKIDLFNLEIQWFWGSEMNHICGIHTALISRGISTIWKLTHLDTAYLTCFSCSPSIAGWKEIVQAMVSYSICSMWWCIKESILETVLALIDCQVYCGAFLFAWFLLFTVPLNCMLQFSFLNSAFISKYEKTCSFLIAAMTQS